MSRFNTLILLMLASLLSCSAWGAGTISGTVFNDHGGDSVPTAVNAGDASVAVYDSAGKLVEQVAIGSGGMYVTSELADGEYYLHTINTVRLVDQVYSDGSEIQCVAPCASIVTSQGSPVDVTAGPRSGIDFELSPGFGISGTIRDEMGDGVANVTVCLEVVDDFSDQTFPTGVCGESDNSGAFATRAGVFPDVYRARIDEHDPQLGFLVPELFDDALVTDFTGAGTDIDLSSSDFNAVDFELAQGGKLRFDVSGQADGAGIDEFLVSILPVSGPDGTMGGSSYFRTLISSPGSDGMLTTPAMPAGDYRVALFPDDDVHVGQVINGPACAKRACFDPTLLAATPVSVTVQSTRNVTVSLEPGYTISGTMTDDMDAPVTSGQVSVHFADGRSAGARGTGDSQSSSYVTELLPAGSDYRVLAEVLQSDLIPQVYAGMPAVPPDLAAGTPVAVGPDIGGDGNASGIDFQFASGGVIEADFMDNATAGLVNGDVFIDLYLADGRFVRTFTGFSGLTETYGLPAGDYRLIGGAENRDFSSGEVTPYVPELYDGISTCAFFACDPTQGTPIDVMAGTVPVTFGLDLKGTLVGTVSESSGMESIQGFVQIYSGMGDLLHSVPVDPATGQFSASLPPGGYLLAVRTTDFFIDEIHDGADGIACPGSCEEQILSGIEVTINSDMDTDVSFVLEKGGSISGIVSDPLAGEPVKGLEALLYDVSQGTIIGEFNTDPGGVFRTYGIPAGTYRVLVDGDDLGYFNEIYDDIACDPASCESDISTSGDDISVSVGVATTGIDFQLNAGDAVAPATLDSGDELGASVAICGTRAAFGLPGDDTEGSDAGAVVLYRREGTTYIQLGAPVYPSMAGLPEPHDGRRFGASVACEDDKLVIGAPANGAIVFKGMGPSKAAAILQISGNTVSSLANLIAGNLGAGAANIDDNSEFGEAVAIGGGTVVVGAPGANAMPDGSGNHSGAAIVVDIGDPENSVAMISDPQAENGAGFGMAVAASGGNVAVGAPKQTPSGLGANASGMAHIFRNLAGSGWGGSPAASAFSESGEADDSFGTSVAIQGDMMAAGAPGADMGGQADSGGAFVFQFDGDSFTQVGGAIQSSEPTPGGNFGQSVALAGSSIAIGSPGAENGNNEKTGAGYLFNLGGTGAGSVWNQVQRRLSQAAGSDSGYGSVVAYDGESFVIGAPRSDLSALNAGYAEILTNGDRLFRGGFE